jgi:hypothetical protein
MGEIIHRQIKGGFMKIDLVVNRLDYTFGDELDVLESSNIRQLPDIGMKNGWLPEYIPETIHTADGRTYDHHLYVLTDVLSLKVNNILAIKYGEDGSEVERSLYSDDIYRILSFIVKERLFDSLLFITRGSDADGDPLITIQFVLNEKRRVSPVKLWGYLSSILREEEIFLFDDESSSLRKKLEEDIKSLG